MKEKNDSIETTPLFHVQEGFKIGKIASPKLKFEMIIAGGLTLQFYEDSAVKFPGPVKRFFLKHLLGIEVIKHE